MSYLSFLNLVWVSLSRSKRIKEWKAREWWAGQGPLWGGVRWGWGSPRWGSGEDEEAREVKPSSGASALVPVRRWALTAMISPPGFRGIIALYCNISWQYTLRHSSLSEEQKAVISILCCLHVSWPRNLTHYWFWLKEPNPRAWIQLPSQFHPS